MEGNRVCSEAAFHAVAVFVWFGFVWCCLFVAAGEVWNDGLMGRCVGECVVCCSFVMVRSRCFGKGCAVLPELQAEGAIACWQVFSWLTVSTLHRCARCGCGV